MIGVQGPVQPTPPKFVLGGISVLVASPFALVAVAFVAPQFGLFFVTLSSFSMIALNVVGTWLIRRLVAEAPRFPWRRVSLAIAATFSGVFMAAATLAAQPIEIAYLAALIGTMGATGLLWRAYEKKMVREVRATRGKER